MRKINKKHIAAAIACSLLCAVTGCGAVNESDAVTEESVTVEMTESTESESATETSVYVPEESLAEEPETEATEAVTEEMATEMSETEESEVTESVVNTENTAETVTTEMSPLTETPYTYTDLNKTMYAKSTVNVRSLPSTDGTQLGSLNKNQSVTVTGQCNETGWYRIVFDNAEAYVSNNFLKELQETAKAVDNVNNPGNADIAAGAVNNAGTGNATVNETAAATNATANTTIEDGYKKDVALTVWDYVNAERTAAGLHALAWDEDLYSFACKRAQEIITDFSHNGCGDHGENIQMNFKADAYTIHSAWYNSPGHHNNYMSSGYVKGACAVYAYNGNVYCVETLEMEKGDEAKEYHDYLANCPTWTASNGVIVRIEDNGNTVVLGKDNPGKTDEELDDAHDEYYGIGRWASSSEQSTPSSSPLTETVTDEPEQTEEPAYQPPVETQPESWTASNGVTVYIQNGNAYTRGDDGYSDDEHYKAWQEYTQCH